jgi:hypothetical protein
MPMRQIPQRCPSSVNGSGEAVREACQPDLQATQTGRHVGSPPLKRAVRTLGKVWSTSGPRSSKRSARLALQADADLGGAGTISTQGRCGQDLADPRLRGRLVAFATYARQQAPPLGDRCLQQWNALVSTLKGLLEALGLKRRTKTLPSLTEHLAAKGEEGYAPTGIGQTEGGDSGDICSN